MKKMLGMLKNVSLCRALLLTVLVALCFGSVQAQFNSGSMTMDGNASETAYVNQGAYHMAWDNTYLYVRYSGGQQDQPVIMHFDVDVQNPVDGGTNANGSLVGQTNWGITPTLPFRSDFQIYWESTYAEFRTDNGAGGWSGATAIAAPGDRSNTGAANREIRLAWTWMGLTGRPAAFNWLSFANSRVTPGSIFNQVPSENPGGALATPTLNYYYTVSTTDNISSITNPFAQKSFESRSNLTLTTANTFWDFTINGGTLINTASHTINNQCYVASGTLTQTGARTLTFGSLATHTPSLRCDGTINPNNGFGNDLICSFSNGITTLSGTATDANFRLFNINVANGATLQAPSSGTVTLGLQFGTMTVNGTGIVNFQNGSGVVNINVVTNGTNNYNFSNSSGTVNFNNLTVSLSATFRPITSGTHYLNFKGNLVNTNGTYSTSNTGILHTTFNGTTAQSIATSATFNNLTISNASATVSYLGGTITIASGYTLYIAPSARLDIGNQAMTITGATVSVDGFFRRGGAIGAGAITGGSATNFLINATGTYEHNYTSNQGVIPLATWAVGSTCAIIGYTSGGTVVAGTNFNQQFHHFVWNCPNQTSTINLQGFLTNIKGDFVISNTGATARVTLTSTTSYGLVVKGNLILNCTVVGNNAILDLASGNANPVSVTISGGMTLNTGTITASNTANPRNIYFDDNTGGVKTINQVSGTLSGSINWNVSNSNGSILRLLTDMTFTTGGSFNIDPSATFDFQTFALKGTVVATAAFSASSGSFLISANTDAAGCFQSGTAATTGSVQAAYGGGRTFTSPSLTFNGTNQQWTGNAVTGTIPNLTINNTGTTSNVVNLSTALSISNVLTLTNGILSLGNNSCTVTNSAANAVVGGSSNAYVRTGNASTTLGRFLRTIATAGLPLTYVMPIGNSTSYMPASFTFTTNSTGRNLSMFAMDGTHSSLSTATNYLANRYWITSLTVATGGTYNYTATFQFSSSDVVGGFSTLKLYRASNSYTDAGSTATSTTVTSSALDQTTGALTSNVVWTALGSGVGLSDQTITFNALSAITYGSSATVTLTATASSGLPVTYTVVSGPATVSGSTLTITGAGSIVIQANQAGNGSYNPAPAVSQTLVVNTKALTVSGATAQNKVYDGTTAATITGGSLVGVVGSDVVTLSGGGTFAQSNAANGIVVTPALSISGAQVANYTLTQPTGLAANITQASQTITFGALNSVQVGSANFNLSASASSGLAVTYSSSNSSVATVTSGGIVTIVGVGTTVITASQSGNTNYSAATSVNQNLVVTQASLITWDMSTQTGGSNNFGTSPLNGVLSSNVASGQLLRGAGVTTTGTGAAGGWGGLGWQTNVTPNLSSTAYIDFTVRVSPGFSMSLSDIPFLGYQRSVTGPASGVLRYSVDGGTTFNTISTLSFSSTSASGSTLTGIDLSGIAALQNLYNCTTVIFRLIPYAASGGVFYIFNANASSAPDLAVAGTVSPLALDPVVSIVSTDTDNVFCANASATFTATASASTPITYQWKKDGVNIIGANAATYATTTLTTGSISVSIDACGESATSNALANTVLNTPTLSVSSSLGNVVCAGTTPTFTAGGATTYDFFLNGVSQATASSTTTYTPSTALSAGDVVCVRGYDPLPFTIDGNLNDAYWGVPLATSAGGPSSSGFPDNRIDALYLKNGFGYLFGGIAGKLVPNNPNPDRILMFIDSRSGGYNNLGSWTSRSNAPGVSVKNLNGGIQFDSGFEPELILAINIFQGVVYYDLYDMITNTNLYLDDANSSLYAYQANAGTGDYTKGFEFSIPIDYLGNYGSNLKVMVMIANTPNANNATFLSNQFLSPAGSGDGNYGSGSVNFGLANPNPVTYSVIQDCYAEQCFTVASSVSPSVSITSSDADNSICAGTSVTFTATTTNGGTTPAYQWKLNGANVGTDATTYTNASLSNNDVVTVVLTANNACQTSSTANGNSITTTVNSTVTPGVSIVSDDADNSICSGTSVTFTATPTNGGTTPSYQWKLNGTNVGTDATTYTNASLANNDVVTVVLTANNACQTSSTANGNSITTTVINNVTPSVSITSSDPDNSICQGTSVTFTANPTNGGTTPSYQWKLNGTNVGTDATTYTNASLANNDVVTVVLTANNACQTSSTANGNSITTTVNSTVTPGVSIVSDDADNSICSGTSVTFTATPTNGGTTPSYQWKLNGTNVGTDAATYTNASLSNNDVVTVVLTANNACQASSTANGNSITTTVNSTVTPGVSIVSDDADNSICSGTSVIFTATPSNGGTTPAYQWKLNGTNVGTDATTYTNASLSNNDVVTVVLTANNACQTSSIANGNSITTTVNSTVTPGVSIVSDDADNSICSGTSVTFTATPTNGGTTPSYQWKLNGTNVGTDATTYTNASLANNDVVTVVLTANNACQTSSTANGNSITTTVINNVTPSVAITSSDADNSICSGTSVTFTATPSNGGTTPAYQWKLNGTNVGTDATTYTNASLANNDVVTVVLTANNTCQTSSTANGNSITTTVINNVTPSVSITSSDADNSICSGTSVTFTATPSNGGTTPAYQWKLNGTNVGTDATTYTNASLANNDVVTVVLTANNACQTSSTANGNSITTTVINNVTPSVSITSSDADNSICSGTSVTFTATPTNGGTTPSYQWKLNGTNVGSNASTFSTTTLANNDVVTIVLTASNTCQSSSTVNGNSIITTVGVATTYYLDLDQDGYGANGTGVSDCVQPNGYSAQNGDCNPADEMVYPGAVEFCNQSDDDCDGIVDEDLVFQDFYLDLDGDGYGANSSAFSACDLPSGYIVAGGDCNDANINVYPGAQELCSTVIDDDCDGLINEICAPGNDNPAFAINCPLSTLSTCTTVTGTLQGASPSGSFGANVLSNNNDVWYYFTANGPGMTIRCTPNGNDVGLELRSSSGVLLKSMNATSNPTDEYMNYDDLIFGNQYYLRVMNMNGAQSGNGFSLCARRVNPGNSAFNYTNVFVYNTGCTDVVPTNLSTFTSTTILLTPVGGGLTYSAPGPVAQLGSFLSNDGFGVNYNTVYTGQVIKNIAFPLGDGSTELLSFNTNVTNTLNVLPCVDIDLGSNYICPRLWGVGAMMRADRWICGAVKYQWRFQQYLNGQPYLVNGNPVIIEQYGANGSRDIFTLASYGFLPGSEWRVKIRPVFPNNVHGDYGTDEQCMKFKGSFAASPIWEEAEGEWNAAEKFVLYPNPSLNGQLSVVGMTEDAGIQQIIVRDATGRLVKQWESTGEEQTMVSMNLAELKSGMYWISIMGSGKEWHQRWIKE